MFYYIHNQLDDVGQDTFGLTYSVKCYKTEAESLRGVVPENIEDYILSRSSIKCIEDTREAHEEAINDCNAWILEDSIKNNRCKSEEIRTCYSLGSHLTKHFLSYQERVGRLINDNKDALSKIVLRG